MNFKLVLHTIGTKNILMFLFILILIMQISCNKKENAANKVKPEPPIAFIDMLNCHSTNAWDSLAIHSKLLGKWRWKYIKCYWKPEDANNEDFKNLLVDFLPDNTLQLFENGQQMQTSTWKIVGLNDGFFKIDVVPLAPLLTGKILFCDSLVLFYDSYVDGCDNYFKQIN